MRLSDAQRRSLEALVERHRTRSETLTSYVPEWIGTLEGAGEGSTLGSLADRGLAEIKWADKPHRRLVARVTQEGLEAHTELVLTRRRRSR